jgi:hypothetical protein
MRIGQTACCLPSWRLLAGAEIKQCDINILHRSTSSRVVHIFAIVVEPQTLCARWVLFSTFSFSVFAVDTAVLRTLLHAREFVLACPEPSSALITCWLRLVALNLLFSTSDACFAFHWHGRRRRISYLRLFPRGWRCCFFAGLGFLLS